MSAPRLLVSVRDVDEAQAALAGGADILDVKEPNQGSLGRADGRVIQQIASALTAHPGMRLSVALGEVQEGAPSEAWELPCPISFAKLGLAGMALDKNWRDSWLRIRAAYEQNTAAPVQWIAVIYADAELAQAPHPHDIIEAALDTECAGVLVDTWGKSAGALLDHVSSSTLAEWSNMVRQHQLLFAVAGRLQPHDFPQLEPAAPDIIAVRSAACIDQNRQAKVSQERVAQLKRDLIRVWSGSPRAVATRSCGSGGSED